MDCYNYQPMIYAYEQENIAVTGKGTVDGGGENANWWRMCGAVKYGYEFDKGIISQRIGRPILMEWNEKGVPVEQRKMATDTACASSCSTPSSARTCSSRT